MDLKERKKWNENHKILKDIINKPEKHTQAIHLFLSQHALLHSSAIDDTSGVTLEDVLVKNLDEEIYRAYPVPKSDTKNSIVWHLWHIARIEDMTMNILLANVEQILYSDCWLKK